MVKGKIYATRKEIYHTQYYTPGMARTVYHILFGDTLLGILSELMCHKTGKIVGEYFSGVPLNR